MKSKKRDNTLISCPYCGSVNEVKVDTNIYCHNCKSKIASKTDISLNIAWSMLITAMIFYVLANIYPILEFNKFGVSHSNTIIGGVLALWEEGSYPIAIIIFLASVFVPFLKFVLIIYILINSKRPLKGSKKVSQAKLYHFTHIIGPWSMIDIFVVAILVGVLHLNSIKVSAGVGATSFVLMVFFTMLSTIAIDARLIKEREDGD